MKQYNFIAILTVTFFLITSCVSRNRKTNWNISLDKNDRKPYGGYIAHESIKLLFPSAKIIDISKGFKYTSIDNQMMHPRNGRSMLIALGLDFYVSQSELKKLLVFAAAGNELVIFSRIVDSKLETHLKAYIQNNGTEEVPLSPDNNGEKNIDAITVVNNKAKFGYFGRSILSSIYISSDSGKTAVNSAAHTDTNLKARIVLTDTLGFVHKKPNFLRFSIGSGHIFVHAAPLVLSNYFLLQKDNKIYLEKVFSFMPDDVSNIYWNDFYKRDARASDLSILLKYPSTKWGVIIAVFSLLAYILFESKRRQNIIPEVKPLENSTVSFVDTIGRLYFNKANHTNLSEKMIQHFLEWVRSHYFITTNQLDERFITQLTVKSGLPETTVRPLTELIRDIQSGVKTIDEVDLYHLYSTIQQFYTNTTRYGS